MELPEGIDPLFYAQSKLRRRQFDACIDICTQLLERNPYDKVGALLPMLLLVLLLMARATGGVVLEDARTDAEKLD